MFYQFSNIRIAYSLHYSLVVLFVYKKNVHVRNKDNQSLSMMSWWSGSLSQHNITASIRLSSIGKINS